MKRYHDVARLLAKYGRPDVFGDPEGVRASSPEESAKAEELTDDLVKMGPTFVKLGQLLSTRADIMPPQYLAALSRLQDDVEPFPFDQVEAIVEVEIGARLSTAFSEFEEEPMAAASLGQVHRARLRDGREVAVKVQRPEIKQEMLDDLRSLEDIAHLVDGHTDLGRFEIQKLIKQFRESLLLELDYRAEGRNLSQIRRRLREFESIVVPAPIPSYVTERVLTMEWVTGAKITKLNPVVRTDFDGAALAEQLFRAYLQQILVDGFFHADPHPGNVLLTDDHRVALIDLGMVGRVSPRMQGYLLQLLLAISEGRAEDAATVSMKIGDIQPDFEELEFRRGVTNLVAQTQDADVSELQMGAIVLEVTQTAAATGVRLPPELAMIGKTLLNLDIVGRTLDETFDPNAAIRQYSAEVLQRRLLQSVSPGNLFSGMLETKDLLERLPERLNRIIDSLADNKFRVEIDAIDERELITGIQKIANRITIGLILAALIVGAALLMRVETEFRIFGYPGLAMICFLLAAGGGAALALSILVSDRSTPKRSRER